MHRYGSKSFSSYMYFNKYLDDDLLVGWLPDGQDVHSTWWDDDDESTLALAEAGKCLFVDLAPRAAVWLTETACRSCLHFWIFLACTALDASVASCLDVQQWENSINEAKNTFWFRICRHFQSKIWDWDCISLETQEMLAGQLTRLALLKLQFDDFLQETIK